eukprot:GCRY01005611.1.p1 GENE.GCRY01005611.1~~GCRY01005611.1.p1  ORF type:complete len:371 (+),score=80.03 GCRY01005611.1:106-1218(+)
MKSSSSIIYGGVCVCAAAATYHLYKQKFNRDDNVPSDELDGFVEDPSHSPEIAAGDFEDVSRIEEKWARQTNLMQKQTPKEEQQAPVPTADDCRQEPRCEMEPPTETHAVQDEKIIHFDEAALREEYDEKIKALNIEHERKAKAIEEEIESRFNEKMFRVRQAVKEEEKDKYLQDLHNLEEKMKLDFEKERETMVSTLRAKIEFEAESQHLARENALKEAFKEEIIELQASTRAAAEQDLRTSIEASIRADAEEAALERFRQEFAEKAAENKKKLEAAIETRVRAELRNEIYDEVKALCLEEARQELGLVLRQMMAGSEAESQPSSNTTTPAPVEDPTALSSSPATPAAATHTCEEESAPSTSTESVSSS